MIKIENLKKSYPSRRDNPGFKEFILNIPKYLFGKQELFWALRGISFSVKRGECVGVIGKNGAGKSTLLSVLLGATEPASGRVEISGKSDGAGNSSAHGNDCVRKAAGRQPGNALAND